MEESTVRGYVVKISEMFYIKSDEPDKKPLVKIDVNVSNLINFESRMLSKSVFIFNYTHGSC